MKWRNGPRRVAGLTTLLVALSAALVLCTSGALAGGNAGYTTFDAVQGGCLDGPNGVDCNNYDSKGDVYMNGGPATGAGLNDGDYYFTVIVPGHQNGGFIQGADGNLSDKTNGSTAGDLGSGDEIADRTFTISTVLGHKLISYGGPHGTGTSPNGQLIVQLIPYDDTSNNGGVYIMAICEVGATSPSQCKFDAFRINGQKVTPAADLTASKTAVPDFTREYTWDITKSACAHGVTACTQRVEQVGGTVQFDYAVTVTKSAASDSGWQVGGDITVANPIGNTGDVMNIDVTDAIDNSGVCDVDNTGTDSQNLGTLAPGASKTVSYVCTFSSNPLGGTNTATVTWNPNLSDGSVTPLSSYDATADYTFSDPTTINGDCIAVTDNFNGTITTLSPTPAGECATKTYNYSHTVNVPNFGCTSYSNTATFSGAEVTTGLKGSDSQTVSVCGPTRTGALTMGFWKGPNGQALITTYGSGLYAWLHGLGPNAAGPFSGVNTLADINAIFKAASATNMNAMLRAQMLATALDYYFGTTGLGWSTTAVGKIKPPSGFLINNGLSTFTMDMTSICPMVDNLSTGTATCTSGHPSTNGFSAGAFPSASMTVLALLNYEASNPPYTTSGIPGIWYAGNRTKEEIAKNAFDQINNSDAFGP